MVRTFRAGGVPDAIVDTSVKPFPPPNSDFGRDLVGILSSEVVHEVVSDSVSSVGREKKAKLFRLPALADGGILTEVVQLGVTYSNSESS